MTLIEQHDPPQTCAWAFKEWSGVCRALSEGRQSIILRKGGIAEANGRFAPDHSTFWLYPTHLHESQQDLRDGSQAQSPEPSGGSVPIDAIAMVSFVGHVGRLEPLAALAAFHVWSEETIVRRFQYRNPGLWVLGVRVYRLEQPVQVAITPAHAGCKSWVELEQPIATAGARAVLADAEFARQMKQVAALIDPAHAGQPA